jgi:uncharacterized membrane protein
MGRERVLAMDLLRGLAVAAMIGVHTVNALLDPALRQGALSAVVHFASGLPFCWATQPRVPSVRGCPGCSAASA